MKPEICDATFQQFVLKKEIFFYHQLLHFNAAQYRIYFRAGSVECYVWHCLLVKITADLLDLPFVRFFDGCYKLAVFSFLGILMVKSISVPLRLALML